MRIGSLEPKLVGIPENYEIVLHGDACTDHAKNMLIAGPKKRRIMLNFNVSKEKSRVD
jgi:hypothetical protein